MVACCVVLVAALAASAGRVEGGRPESESESKEYRVKAAFLFNFITYTTWPKGSFDDPKDPIVLAIVGKDPFGNVLDATFRGERIHGRRVQIDRHGELPEKLKAHVVFCSNPDAKEREELIATCAPRPILLVGEDAGFAEDGATMNFYYLKKKVRFEINTDAVSLSGLQVSSELLKLAKIVKTRKKQ